MTDTACYFTEAFVTDLQRKSCGGSLGVDGQSVQLDVFSDPKSKIYSACDLISKSLGRLTRELGGRLRKFLFRFWFAVRNKLIPTHRLPILIEHAKHDADSFDSTSIYYVAGLSAHVEHVCEATHDKLPSRIILYLTRALEMRVPLAVVVAALAKQDGKANVRGSYVMLVTRVRARCHRSKRRL